MKKIAIAIAAFATLMFSTASFARDPHPTYVLVTANRTTVNALDFKEFGPGARIGFQMFPIFAVEIGYDMFGKAKYSTGTGTTSARLDGVSLAAVFRGEVVPNTFVRGSIGQIRIRQNLAGVEDVSEPFFGIGIEQRLGKHVGITGEFRRVDVDGDKVNNFDVGLKLNF